MPGKASLSPDGGLPAVPGRARAIGTRHGPAPGGSDSVRRVLGLQCRGREFDPHPLHQEYDQDTNRNQLPAEYWGGALTHKLLMECCLPLMG